MPAPSDPPRLTFDRLVLDSDAVIAAEAAQRGRAMVLTQDADVLCQLAAATQSTVVRDALRTDTQNLAQVDHYGERRID